MKVYVCDVNECVFEGGRGVGLAVCVWITVFRSSDMPTILCTCHPTFQFYLYSLFLKIKFLIIYDSMQVYRR